jgi:hypothetical protein
MTEPPHVTEVYRIALPQGGVQPAGTQADEVPACVAVSLVSKPVLVA